MDDEVRTGLEATYPNSLIITILILKSLFGFDSERPFLRFLALHYHGVFSKLPERSWFNFVTDRDIPTEHGLVPANRHDLPA